jgi:hypothetical protein
MPVSVRPVGTRERSKTISTEPQFQEMVRVIFNYTFRYLTIYSVITMSSIREICLCKASVTDLTAKPLDPLNRFATQTERRLGSGSTPLSVKRTTSERAEFLSSKFPAT